MSLPEIHRHSRGGGEVSPRVDASSARSPSRQQTVVRTSEGNESRGIAPAIGVVDQGLATERRLDEGDWSVGRHSQQRRRTSRIRILRHGTRSGCTRRGERGEPHAHAQPSRGPVSVHRVQMSSSGAIRGCVRFFETAGAAAPGIRRPEGLARRLSRPPGAPEEPASLGAGHAANANGKVGHVGGGGYMNPLARVPAGSPHRPSFAQEAGIFRRSTRGGACRTAFPTSGTRMYYR